jgi:antitoxin (DNA-binding transcriptional repressor) of toxin-antitoxin stability system
VIEENRIWPEKPVMKGGIFPPNSREMLKRVHILTIVAVVTAASGFAATPDGSTIAKAIPLKQRKPRKAVEEEMAWMMKLYHYTPLLALRDRVAEEIRKVKAGKKSTNTSAGWGHGTVDHNGHWISVWWFDTPRGKRDVYFDTGTLINTPREVARQESARADYMRRTAPTLKVQ